MNSKKYKGKLFFLDTSILLDSPDHLVTLSQGGENTIYISNIVVKELNGHKEDSISEKGFYAREFARAIDGSLSESDSSTIKLIDNDRLTTFTYKSTAGDTVDIHVITRPKYLSESNSNDLKIIEVAKSYKLDLVTNDIYLKLEAQTLGVTSSSLKSDKVDSPELILFSETLEFDTSFGNTNIELDYLAKNCSLLKPWTQITLTYKDSNKKDMFIVNNLSDHNSQHRYVRVRDKDISKIYPVSPINSEQKFYAAMMSDPSFEIGVTTGSTGSGKTLLAVQEGIRRVKDPQSSINGIVYLRNTVTANDKASELGFRKGSQDEKLSYFAYPLYGAINFIINNRGKKDTGKASDETDKDTVTEAFMTKHNIKIMDVAHARGTTIQNKWIIFDELQNAAPDTVKLIGTRVGKGCKLIMLGDFKQVDHPYLTKNRNGLVSMLKIAKERDGIAAIQLQKTIRSSIAEWFDKNL